VCSSDLAMLSFSFCLFHAQINRNIETASQGKSSHIQNTQERDCRIIAESFPESDRSFDAAHDSRMFGSLNLLPNFHICKVV
jgi:hypothetical protein